ncbi:MAG: tRNA lysidine(34) synthetase TilS [Gammaproteobacteria bacterium]|nr:tRNA lysidine(34) synthetase TilS [Gammaproteobacteria bacterium]
MPLSIDEPVSHAICQAAEFSQTAPWLIAYSGGLDSHVLLHASAKLLQQGRAPSISVIHVDHGLQAESGQWVNHCAQVVANLRLPLEQFTVTVPQNAGESLEAAARHVRYDVFEKVLPKEGLLLTAHHQIDQVETVFLQLLRGAGPKGLAAMPLRKPFAQGWHIRPFLMLNRTALEQYAEQNQLDWIDDPSNACRDFDRNYVRHEILPLIQTRWPGYAKAISRVARLQGEAAELLDLSATRLLEDIENSDDQTLPIDAVLNLNLLEQKNLIRSWLNALNLTMPSEVKLQTIHQQMLLARQDAMPCVTWGGGEVRRYAGKLYAMKPQPVFDSRQRLDWALGHKCLQVPGLSQSLSMDVLLEQGFTLSESGRINVRFRQGGETIKPAGRGVRKALKALFQEWAVPPWERVRTPLIYVGNTLAAVYGFAVDEAFYTAPDGF